MRHYVLDLVEDRFRIEITPGLLPGTLAATTYHGDDPADGMRFHHTTTGFGTHLETEETIVANNVRGILDHPAYCQYERLAKLSGPFRTVSPGPGQGPLPSLA